MAFVLDLDKLENIIQTGGGAFKCGCPACMEEGSDSKRNHLYVFPDGRYGCAAKRDAEHSARIYKLVGLTPSSEKREFVIEHKEPIVEKETIFNEEDLVRLLPFSTYWNKRGISDKTLEVFKGGLSTGGKMDGRYCFPIYDSLGRIHGMTGRWIKESPAPGDIKWKHLGKTSNWLYPYHFNFLEIRNKREVILVESIGDMLALWEAGYKNSLVLFGVNISQRVLGGLVGLNPKKIIVSTNNDIKHSVGQDAATRIMEKILPFFDENIVEIKLPPKKDYGEMTAEEIKDFYARTSNTN